MGLFQSLKNGLDRVGDTLNGRSRGLWDIYADIIRDIEIGVGEFTDKYGNQFSQQINYLHAFLTRQMAYLCEAESILRCYSAYEVFREHKADSRTFRIYSAMQYEIEKKGQKAEFHDILYLSLCTIRNEHTYKKGEKLYLGYDIASEYFDMRDEIKDMDHSHLVDYYQDYMPHLEVCAIECLCDHCGWQEYDAPNSDYLLGEAFRHLLKSARKAWESNMVTARLTDISNNFLA